MLNRYQRRLVAANARARGILADYGNDVEAASDRVLELCDGDRRFAGLVQREMRFLTRKRRQPQRQYRLAA